jgi:hypothetical protein
MESSSCLTSLLFFLGMLFGSTMFSGPGTVQPALSTREAVTAAPVSVSVLKGKLAFVLEVNSKAEIYVMNPDGTDLHAITNDGVVNWFPTFSPDGK